MGKVFARRGNVTDYVTVNKWFGPVDLVAVVLSEHSSLTGPPPERYADYSLNSASSHPSARRAPYTCG